MKKSKKYYDFKILHKRKKRTRSAKVWWKSGGAEYKKMQQKLFRAQSKEVLRKKMNEKEVEFRLFKKTMWWDF